VDAAPTRLVVIRHGETDWNAESRMQGQTDAALSRRGRWQAERLAATLGGEGIEAIVASDLARALDTAGALGAALGLPVSTDVGLRERCFGVFEGHTYAEIEARWPDEALRWRRHEADFGPDGGERLVDFAARAVAAVRRAAEAHAGRTVAVVTHGGVLDSLYRAAYGLESTATRTWQLGNTGVNRLLWTGEGFTVTGWGDTSHLDGLEPPLDDGSEGDAAAVAAKPTGAPP
jgi:probable phosphoglycerate mutase